MMISKRIPQKRNAGFSTVGAIASTMVIAAQVFTNSTADEFLTVRAAARSFVEQLKNTQNAAVAENVDRRIRITGECTYVRERRAVASWVLEQEFLLPAGLKISGPEQTAFDSHGATDSAALFTISGPKNLFRREIIAKKDGTIMVQ
jgi:hypothetical protein